jgi:hypothetical protein
MTSREERRRRLREASKEAAEAASALLADELAALQGATTVDLEALRPKVKDKASLDALIAAVAESTRQNESKAQLRRRITKLGEGVVSVAGRVARLLGR